MCKLLTHWECDERNKCWNKSNSSHYSVHNVTGTIKLYMQYTKHYNSNLIFWQRKGKLTNKIRLEKATALIESSPPNKTLAVGLLSFQLYHTDLPLKKKNLLQNPDFKNCVKIFQFTPKLQRIKLCSCHIVSFQRKKDGNTDIYLTLSRQEVEESCLSKS